MITTINPATAKELQSYPTLSKTELNEKLTIAHQAYQSWRQTSFKQRRTWMLALAELLQNNASGYAKTVSAEMGKPLKAAAGEIEKCALVCEYYAEHAEKILSPRHITTESINYVCFQPTGTLLGIMPWNFPYWQVFRFAAANLMAGNNLIIKHAPNCCQTGIEIEALFTQAGFPKGVLQNVIIEVEQVEQIIAHPAISGVSLTGSQRAGKAVASIAGQHLKKCVLELGGSDPYLILADAEIAYAAKTCVQGRLFNGGQVCISAKRLIVVDAVYDQFKAAVISEVANYTVGDPQANDTDIGPLARVDLHATVTEQLHKCISQGASIIYQSETPNSPGYYFPITVIDNVTPGMPAYEAEIFGPVVALIRAKDEREAIHIANCTEFGLGAGVFTKDLKKGQRLAETELLAGACVVNGRLRSDPKIPFGGIKQSGFGRELGAEGMLEFINCKSVSIAESA
jgi:succinate-semialdehyde dehydrogenase / glutarate-semialdehyde dehydrogenase